MNYKGSNIPKPNNLPPPPPIRATPPMSNYRFSKIMADLEDLTANDVRAGWHFCLEMDGLLLNSNDPGNEFCHCLKAKQCNDDEAVNQ